MISYDLDLDKTKHQDLSRLYHRPFVLQPSTLSALMFCPKRSAQHHGSVKEVKSIELAQSQVSLIGAVAAQHYSASERTAVGHRVVLKRKHREHPEVMSSERGRRTKAAQVKGEDG